jgi:hypothetical protein
MVCKKVVRVSKYSVNYCRDNAINQIMINGNMTFGLPFYNIIAASPLDIAVSLIAVKLGITNKILIGLIIAFLI